MVRDHVVLYLMRLAEFFFDESIYGPEISKEFKYCDSSKSY